LRRNPAAAAAIRPSRVRTPACALPSSVSQWAVLSKRVRWTAVVIVVATVVLEVVAYLVYRNAIDGVFVNMAVAVYGLFAFAGLWAIDRLVRRVRRRSARRPA
jgi:hypothetical protein